MCRLPNNQGMILVTVAIIVSVMMIISISLFSMRASQSISAENQIERLTAKQVAKYAFWKNYMSLVTTNAAITSSSLNLDGRTYNYTIVSDPGAGIYNTTVYNVIVSY